MKALTIYQPWAGLVIHGPKRFENRNHNSFRRHRGELAIHAARADAYCYGVIGRLVRTLGVNVETVDRWITGPSDRTVFSAIIGVVSVIDFGPPSHFSAGDNRDVFLEGPFAMKFAEPIALPTPVQCRGRQGLWAVPTDVESAIREQLEAETEQT